MAKNDFENGVWRTVGGRRIFIRDGESLSSAMKKSGKFKNDKTKDKDDDKKEQDFSKSKVKETLYHGTDEDFEEFSLDKFGKHDQGDFGKGIYFAENKQTASKYGKNIKEVNVNIEKPLEINSHEDYKKMWHEVAKNVDKSKLSKEDLELYNDKYTPQEDKDFILYDTLSADEKMNTFKKMGYDGIIDKTYHQVIVFDKKQIKIKKK